MDKKYISDIVRDKIISERAKHPEVHTDKLQITITDEEACRIWSALTDIEADIHNFKCDISKLIKQSARMERHLSNTKREIRNIRKP